MHTGGLEVNSSSTALSSTRSTVLLLGGAPPGGWGGAGGDGIALVHAPIYLSAAFFPQPSSQPQS